MISRKIEILAKMNQSSQRCVFCGKELRAILFSGYYIPAYRPYKTGDYCVWRKINVNTDLATGIFAPVYPDNPFHPLDEEMQRALSRARLKFQGVNIYTDIGFQFRDYFIKSKPQTEAIWVIELSCFNCHGFKRTYSFFEKDSLANLKNWDEI